MATTYNITGQVVETQTGQSLSNFRVEGWGKDLKCNDLLDVAITNGEGVFDMSFDSDHPDTVGGDAAFPAVYFKVYLGKRLLKSTESKPLLSPKEGKGVSIKIDMPEIRPEGTDRLTSEQALKASEFLRTSDFAGIYSQYVGKAGTSWSLFSDMLVNTAKKFDFQPLKMTGVQEHQIVNQDVEAVRENLKTNNITINKEYAYNPLMDAATMKSFSVLPINLKAGQQVDLYKDRSGKVRYYALAKTSATSLNTAVQLTDTQGLQLNKMEKELAQTKQLVAEKDAQINKLEEELTIIRKDQSEMKALFNSKAFKTMMKEFKPPSV